MWHDFEIFDIILLHSNIIVTCNFLPNNLKHSLMNMQNKFKNKYVHHSSVSQKLNVPF